MSFVLLFCIFIHICNAFKYNTTTNQNLGLTFYASNVGETNNLLNKFEEDLEYIRELLPSISIEKRAPNDHYEDGIAIFHQVHYGLFYQNQSFQFDFNAHRYSLLMLEWVQQSMDSYPLITEYHPMRHLLSLQSSQTYIWFIDTAKSSKISIDALRTLNTIKTALTNQDKLDYTKILYVNWTNIDSLNNSIPSKGILFLFSILALNV